MLALRSDGGRRKIGYAARPGTGPAKQRCNTCAHMARVLSAGIRSHKCEVMAGIWSTDPITDIKPNAPACSAWMRRPFKQVQTEQ
jgi:hypothetical protein